MLDAKKQILILTLSFLATSPVRAEEAKLQSDLILCQLSSTVRSLRVQSGPVGCQTIYTKAGKDQKIGEGQNQDSCKDIMGKVRDNLTKAGWNCRSVSEVGLLTISE